MARLLAFDLPRTLYGANCLNYYEDIMHYTTIRIKKREREGEAFEAACPPLDFEMEFRKRRESARRKGRSKKAEAK